MIVFCTEKICSLFCLCKLKVIWPDLLFNSILFWILFWILFLSSIWMNHGYIISLIHYLNLCIYPKNKRRRNHKLSTNYDLRSYKSRSLVLFSHPCSIKFIKKKDWEIINPSKRGRIGNSRVNRECTAARQRAC